MLSKLIKTKEEEHGAPGFLVLSYDSHGISITACKYAEEENKKIQIVDISFLDREISGSFDSEQHILEAMSSDLAGYVEEKGFEGYESIIILGNDEYTIKMIEKPLAEKEEIKNALKFSMQDFVNYGFDNTIIDYIDLPLLRRSDSVDLVFAVCMPKNNMDKISALVSKTGLLPFCIDIPELSKRHLFEYCYPEEEMAVILHIDVRYCQVMVLYNKDILVIRSLDLSLSVESDNEDWEEVSLEIQRSIDYAGNIFGQQIQSKLYILPTKEKMDRGESFLSSDLGMEIEHIEPSKIDFLSIFLDKEENLNILSVGQVAKNELAIEENNAVN